MTSEDGLTWTDRVVGEEGEHINAMIFDGKRFVGIGQGATYFSLDGKAWERVPNRNAPTTATRGGDVYVVVVAGCFFCRLASSCGGSTNGPANAS